MPQPLRRATGAADSALPRRRFSCFFAIDVPILDKAVPAFHHGNRLRLEMILEQASNRATLQMP
jgi:hypothetical protein